MNSRNKIKTDRLLLHCICIYIITLCVSCTSVINKNEAWEGIQNNTLRVFVKLDIPYTMDRINFEEKMTENLMNAGMNRAGLLLMSHIRIYLSDFERIESCREKIHELQNNGKILYMKCSEEFCSAFIDYEIKNFLDAAGRHEAGQ
jgi:hypothetical protein